MVEEKSKFQKDNVSQSVAKETNEESHACFGFHHHRPSIMHKEVEVETEFGNVHCTVMGVHKGNRPVIMTFHDIGLNHHSCFSPLFSHEDMQEILWHFVVCHVHAPGQHEGASSLPSLFQTVIGLGSGAGAYILTKFALNHPDKVEGLVLININVRAETLMNSVAHKLTGWIHALPDYVINHMFGKDEIQNNPDLIAMYRNHITHSVNQSNLAQFIKSYQNRRDLEIERPIPRGSSSARTLSCPALLVVGDGSPAVEAVVDCNAKLNPTKTTLLKMADCGGLPQVSQPGKLTEALKYFIQGMGHMPWASMTRLGHSRATSASGITCDSDLSHSQPAESQHSHAHIYASRESASDKTAEQNVTASSSRTELAC
uniref:Protein NDRG2 n=1 Tax=Esox lucius TaxID=8010 RepID=A0A6Q2YY94_ESOLU